MFKAEDARRLTNQAEADAFFEPIKAIAAKGGRNYRITIRDSEREYWKIRYWCDERGFRLGSRDEYGYYYITW